MTTLTAPFIASNLAAVYDSATPAERAEGRAWYLDAHEFCATLAARHATVAQYGPALSVDGVAGVLAALSPGRNWEMNKADTVELLEAWADGASGPDLPAVGSYGFGNIRKAERILSGASPLDVLGGRKVRAFYDNIAHPATSQEVTIDRHARAAAWGHRLPENFANLGAPEYRLIAESYRALAASHNLAPHQVQAIVWTHWRNNGQ